jgi:hypothetical protein
MVRLQILDKEWSIANYKALRDTTSEEYYTTTTEMKLSLEIVRELLGVLNTYKDVYCEEMAPIIEA